jgi:hypothetical protein
METNNCEATLTAVLGETRRMHKKAIITEEGAAGAET